mmetsp:Transcript_4788/g.12375  ORF Transcript_4788/g.12375 Transcript_4788/m.12375 type:complete len:332 (+) Transcript_4788:1055-2050(+)
MTTARSPSKARRWHPPPPPPGGGGGWMPPPRLRRRPCCRHTTLPGGRRGEGRERRCRVGRRSPGGRGRQLNLALEKSISGCCFMNFSRMSCLPISSAVGLPRAFWRWSNIIFSTVIRVSPSRSPSLEFSGWTFWVLISGSPTMTHFHHSILFSFCMEMTTSLRPAASSSRVQKQSSTMIFLWRSPSTMGGWFLTPTVMWVFFMSTTRSRDLTAAGTGTWIWSSWSCWVQIPQDVVPPLPGGGGSLSSSSPSSSFLGLSAAAALGAGGSGAALWASFSTSSTDFFRAASRRAAARCSSSARRFFFSDPVRSARASCFSNMRTTLSRALSPTS